jgi:hypothetical protein
MVTWLKFVLVVIFISSGSISSAQINEAYDFQLRSGARTIVLSCKDHGIKKFKIKKKVKFGSKASVKDTYHYRFLNDSVFSYYSTNYFSIIPSISGSSFVYENWFYNKYGTDTSMVVDGQIGPWDTDTTLVEYYKGVDIEYDSLGFKVSKCFMVHDTDTSFFSKAISQKDSLGREIYYEYTLKVERRTKTETRFEKDTSYVSFYTYRNSVWELVRKRKVYSIVKPNEVVTVEQELLLEEKYESSSVVLTERKDKSGLIDKFEKVTTFVFKDSELKPSVSVATLVLSH